MYLRLGSIIINTAQLVHARVSGAGPNKEVLLVMAAGAEIELVGGNADKFLQALPTYTPVEEEGAER